MPKHLFLTGPKRVGKSTLLRTVLENYAGSIGGFYTRRSEEVFPGRSSVHILSAAMEEKPTEENLLFFCGTQDSEATGRFEKLGVELLAVPGNLIVMDELGPHEENATEFRNRVMELLNGDVPVLGVLQQAESPFLREVSQHPKVELVSVTEGNRDALAEFLRGWQSREEQ